MSNAGDGDKRTVTTDALETLGTIIGPNEKRDAIHLAVEPVEAWEDLNPGDHIMVSNGKAGHGPLPIGIVDPFLAAPVKKGERFWFVMYPRQVRSLRHVWTHPAFPDEDTAGVARGHAKALSEQWLRSFCDTHDCPEYEVTLAAAVANADDEYLFFRNRDAHGTIPPDFWDHVEIVTGRKMEYRPAFFSCSC